MTLLAALVSIATATLIHATKQASQAIRDLMDGGPRPPAPPLPSNDAPVLNSRFTVRRENAFFPPQNWSL